MLAWFQYPVTYPQDRSPAVSLDALANLIHFAFVDNCHLCVCVCVCVCVLVSVNLNEWIDCWCWILQ
jgi:hypothetical protein